MKFQLSLMPILAVLAIGGFKTMAAELNPYCEGACRAELTSIMDGEINLKLADVDTRIEAITFISFVGSQSLNQPVRLKAIEILKQVALNLNPEFRMAALNGVTKVAVNSRDLMTELNAIALLKTSADSSYVVLSRRTMENIAEIAVVSPHAAVKEAALKAVELIVWDKKKEKSVLATSVIRQINESAASMAALRQ